MLCGGAIPKSRKFLRRLTCPSVHYGMCCSRDISRWHQLEVMEQRLKMLVTEHKQKWQWLEIRHQSELDAAGGCKLARLVFHCSVCRPTTKVFLWGRCRVEEPESEGDPPGDGAGVMHIHLEYRHGSSILHFDSPGTIAKRIVDSFHWAGDPIVQVMFLLDVVCISEELHIVVVIVQKTCF